MTLISSHRLCDIKECANAKSFLLTVFIPVSEADREGVLFRAGVSVCRNCRDRQDWTKFPKSFLEVNAECVRDFCRKEEMGNPVFEEAVLIFEPIQ